VAALFMERCGVSLYIGVSGWLVGSCVICVLGFGFLAASIRYPSSEDFMSGKYSHLMGSRLPIDVENWLLGTASTCMYARCIVTKPQLGQAEVLAELLVL